MTARVSRPASHWPGPARRWAEGVASARAPLRRLFGTRVQVFENSNAALLFDAASEQAAPSLVGNPALRQALLSALLCRFAGCAVKWWPPASKREGVCALEPNAWSRDMLRKIQATTGGGSAVPSRMLYFFQ
jgi:hypothetical protein